MKIPRLLGQTFGRLTVLSKGTGRKYVCQCECGRKKEIRGDHLKSGHTTSCGCYHSEVFVHVVPKPPKVAPIKPPPAPKVAEIPPPAIQILGWAVKGGKLVVVQKD